MAVRKAPPVSVEAGVSIDLTDSARSSARLRTATQETPSVQRQPWSTSKPFMAYVAVFICLFVFSGLLTAAAVQRTQSVAVADGLVYLDAFYQAREGKVVRRGDTVGAAAVNEFLCEPKNQLIVDSLGKIVEDTGAQAQDSCAEAASVQHQSTAWIHPPTYFLATGAASQVVTSLVPSVEPITAGRLIGAAWFAAGGTVLVWLAALWGARRRYATLVLAALAVTPGFVGVFAHITPDVSFLLVSAGVMVAATLWWRNSLSAPWLLVAGLAAVLFKQPFMLASATAALALVVLQWQGRARQWTEVVKAVAWLGAGTGLGLLGWEAAKRSLSGGPQDAAGPDPFAVPTDLNGLVNLVMTGSTKFALGDGADVSWEPDATVGIAALATAALFGAAVGLVFYGRKRDELRSVAIAGLLVIALGGAAVSLTYAAVGGSMLPPSPRYVFGAFAAFSLPLLVIAHRRIVWVPAASSAGLGLVAWSAFALA